MCGSLPSRCFWILFFRALFFWWFVCFGVFWKGSGATGSIKSDGCFSFLTNSFNCFWRWRLRALPPLPLSLRPSCRGDSHRFKYRAIGILQTGAKHSSIMEIQPQACPFRKPDENFRKIRLGNTGLDSQPYFTPISTGLPYSVWFLAPDSQSGFQWAGKDRRVVEPFEEQREPLRSRSKRLRRLWSRRGCGE